MLPDLRFVIGAVIATALSGVTLFGLAATMHISHQSRVGPLEASRMLAYTPEARHRIFDIPAPRADSPFANIPDDPNPVPLRQQSPEPAAEPPAPPVQTAAIVPPAGVPPLAEPDIAEPSIAEPELAQPASLPSPADTVDERAVVDPPLPLDNDAPAQTVESHPPRPLNPHRPRHRRSLPSPPQHADRNDSGAPAPVVEAPAEPTVTPDVQQVASIPPATDAAPEPRRDVPTIAETREAPGPKAKRARKTKRHVRRTVAIPFASQPSTLFPPGSTTSTANRPAKGFWPLD